MYKLLLTWRYLLTRYIALASVISVTLGVATLIVVNAVMLGFTREMENKMHGVLADVTVSPWATLRGFDDVDQRVADVWRVAGDFIEGVTPTVSTQALLNFQIPGGEEITKPVELIGIDVASQAQVTSIAQFLQHKKNRQNLSFELHENGYDTSNHLAGSNGVERPLMGNAGWEHRRYDAQYERFRREEEERQKRFVSERPRPQSDFDPAVAGLESPPILSPSPVVVSGTSPYSAALANLPTEPVAAIDSQNDPFFGEENPSEENETPNGDPVPSMTMSGSPVAAVDSPMDGFDDLRPKFDKETQQDTGAIIGINIVSGDRRKAIDRETGETRWRETLFLVPGDDVTISTLSLGSGRSPFPEVVFDRFTVTDLYESRMVLYDSSFVFVPIEKLQKMRGMIADDGTRMASHLLIKAKPGVNINLLRDTIRNSDSFPPQLFSVQTWRDSQADMLGAVAIELMVLNVLLFLIIAVAGFGILAIFFMIVVEKTRDIGILKSLGAGGGGVMQIFLFYGLALGLIGSGLGVGVGILFVHHINTIARFLSNLMGHEIFNPEIYNFYEIPAIIEPATVVWVIVGSITIAVMAGVLPALRAARLKPVDALRV